MALYSRVCADPVEPEDAKPTERQCEACDDAAPERCVLLGERRDQVNARRYGKPDQKHHAPLCEVYLPSPGVMLTGHGIFMRIKYTKSAICVLLAAQAGGCAGDPGAYPSLAMRPFERGVVAETPAPPAPIRPAIPAARVAELRAAGAASHAAFLAQESEAARLARAAAGQPFESNARATALVAMADLDAKRSATASTLATIDVLAAEAANALAAEPALGEAQAEIAALLAREDEAIARLWGVMGS
jgi:hypothetical protein